MPDPAEDVPADGPARRGDGDLEFGALGLDVAGTGGVGAVIEPAEQLHRAAEGMEATVAVVTDVHHPPAGRAIAVDDVEFPRGEIRIRGPFVGHRADLHV